MMPVIVIIQGNVLQKSSFFIQQLGAESESVVMHSKLNTGDMVHIYTTSITVRPNLQSWTSGLGFFFHF